MPHIALRSACCPLELYINLEKGAVPANGNGAALMSMGLIPS
jgi:hypothetical protein